VKKSKCVINSARPPSMGGGLGKGYHIYLLHCIASQYLIIQTLRGFCDFFVDFVVRKSKL